MPDTIIVGGGVIGMMTAREFHEAGADVLLVERGPLGGESSWAGGGIISPLYPWQYADSVNRLAEISKSLYPDIAAQLAEESGIDCELQTSGLLFAESIEDAAQAWCRQWDVRCEAVAGNAALREIEPMLAADPDAGLWLPDIMQIRNPRLVKALAGSLETRGIRVREHTPVTDLVVESGRVMGVTTASGAYTAERVVITSGAWSAGLIRDGQSVDVEPVKGQMIMFRGEPGRIRCMVLADGHYIIPRRDGRVLAGSTLEHSGFDKSVTEKALHELHSAAVRIVPVLEDYEIERQWSGLRPGTQNGIPYICEHPEVRGLYINAGHYRNGIVLGAASCRLITDLVLDRPLQLDAAPYALDAEH